MGNWTEQDLARVGPGRDHKPARKPARVHGPNKTEAAYGDFLQMLSRLPGEETRPVWWAYEAIKIRIGVRCWYTPDYLVQYADHHMELHDCKGTTGRGKYYAEDDAIVKARSVSAHFPLPVFFVWRLPCKGNEWMKARM